MNADSPGPDKGRAYQIIIQHLQYDQNIFWQRFGFMLLAQIGTLGFFFSVFAETLKNPDLCRSPIVTILLLLLCAVGVFLVVLFDALRRITAWWIERWLTLLKEIEAEVFGSINLFRSANAPASARNLAKWFMLLFAVIWFGMAGLVLYQLC